LDDDETIEKNVGGSGRALIRGISIFSWSDLVKSRELSVRKVGAAAEIRNGRLLNASQNHCPLSKLDG
jgi:hypothetical protein